MIGKNALGVPPCLALWRAWGMAAASKAFSLATFTERPLARGDQDVLWAAEQAPEKPAAPFRLWE